MLIWRSDEFTPPPRSPATSKRHFLLNQRSENEVEVPPSHRFDRFGSCDRKTNRERQSQRYLIRCHTVSQINFSQVRGDENQGNEVLVGGSLAFNPETARLYNEYYAQVDPFVPRSFASLVSLLFEGKSWSANLCY